VNDVVLWGSRGQYRLYSEIGAGGMASVWLARFIGSAGFSRTVAVKRPLPGLQKDHDFRQLALSEARVAARVQHPNVVATLDLIESGPELLVVMEYVHGEALAVLLERARQRGERVPVDVAVSLLVGALRGLEAVHRARDEGGRCLSLVHRDVSPQNILCGADGVAYVADFGLAKADGYTILSDPGVFKGKLAYASPEQLELRPLTFASDVYSAGVVAWELLTGVRLHRNVTAPEVVAQVLHGSAPAPSSLAPQVPAALDAAVARALARDPAQRHPSALALAHALEAAVRPASVEAVAEWIQTLAFDSLRARAEQIRLAESESVSPIEASAARDTSGPGASDRVTIARRAALKGGALAAGVFMVWFGVEQLWPRAVPPVSPGAGAPALPRATPAPPAATSLAALVAPSDAGTSEGSPTSGARPPARASEAPSRAAPRAVEAARCTPPFSLDAQGIRHMKPGCR
jgi:serine/threonine-protein kinase